MLQKELELKQIIKNLKNFGSVEELIQKINKFRNSGKINITDNEAFLLMRQIYLNNFIENLDENTIESYCNFEVFTTDISRICYFIAEDVSNDTNMLITEQEVAKYLLDSKLYKHIYDEFPAGNSYLNSIHGADNWELDHLDVSKLDVKNAIKIWALSEHGNFTAWDRYARKIAREIDSIKYNEDWD